MLWRIADLTRHDVHHRSGRAFLPGMDKATDRGFDLGRRKTVEIQDRYWTLVEDGIGKAEPVRLPIPTSPPGHGE